MRGTRRGKRDRSGGVEREGKREEREGK